MCGCQQGRYVKAACNKKKERSCVEVVQTSTTLFYRMTMDNHRSRFSGLRGHYGDCSYSESAAEAEKESRKREKKEEEEERKM